MPFLAALILLCGAAFAGDTTYSRTESVPKSSSSGSSDAHGSSHPDRGATEDGDAYVEVSGEGSGDGSGFMNSCLSFHIQLHSFGDLLGAMALWPVIAGACAMADGVWISHVHLFTGSGDMDDWQEGHWRLGLGFGIGASVLPGNATGLPLELNVEATGALTDNLQLRLRAGAFKNPMDAYVDYRRDVFVDGKRIGSQLDVMTDYSQYGYSTIADLIRPLGSHGLYLAGGLGGVLMNESIGYVRLTDYGRGEESREDERWKVLPALDAAVGRYGGGGNHHFWRFEIRYQALLHSPQRVTSFPGDNAYVTHAVTWEWAWF